VIGEVHHLSAKDLAIGLPKHRGWKRQLCIELLQNKHPTKPVPIDRPAMLSWVNGQFRLRGHRDRVGSRTLDRAIAAAW
jgi:hypothetical protein